MGRKAVSTETRSQIIGLSKDQTKSNREIARLVAVSEKCVRTTLYNNSIGLGPCESRRAGRPRKLDLRLENRIFRLARRYPKMSLKNLAITVSDSSSGFKICGESVRLALLKKGMRSYSAVRKPLLTLKHRLKRIHWCKERLNWSVERWKQVIFSDESNFQVINGSTKPIVKRLKNEKYLPQYCVPRVQGGGGSAGIWGCISFKGTGVPYIYSGRMNQQVYIDTMENCLLPSTTLFYDENEPYFYQQDGATCHTAKSVARWFEANNVDILPWCPRSPDLNPIENLWSWMDSKIDRENISNLSQLKDQLHRVWLSIPTRLCEKLIESMPKRVRACYKAKGGHFKY